MEALGGLSALFALGGAMLFGFLAVFLIVGSLIGALIVQLATKMAAGFKPGYGTAFIAVLAAWIAQMVLSWGLGMVLAGMSGALVITFVASFLLNSAILGFMIKNAQGSPLGFGKGCIVTIIEWIIFIVVCVGLVFLLSMLGGGHSP